MHAHTRSYAHAHTHIHVRAAALSSRPWGQFGNGKAGSADTRCDVDTPRKDHAKRKKPDAKDAKSCLWHDLISMRYPEKRTPQRQKLN